MDQIRPWQFIGAYRDTLNKSYEEQIRAGIDFIRQHKDNGVHILVACGASINRWSDFSAAALKEEEGLTLFEAFREVKRYHPESMPHEPVWKSLCAYYGEAIPYLDLMRLGISKG